jgi:hypothetical protein
MLWWGNITIVQASAATVSLETLPRPELLHTHILVTACEITFVQLIFHFIQITVESRFHELCAISAVFVATVHCQVCR